MTSIDLHATRSHRGGHWFDPSIAHRCKASSEALRTALILRSGWELSPYWEKSGRFPSRPAGDRTVEGLAETGLARADGCWLRLVGAGAPGAFRCPALATS